MVKLIVKLCKVIPDIQNFLELWRIQSLTTAEKKNSFQNIGTIKSSVSCTFDSYSQSRWTDKQMG